MSRIFKCLLALLLTCGAPAVSQPSSNSLNLRQLTRAAGSIFAGRVLSVSSARTQTGGDSPMIRITFQVEQGLHGVRTGARLTIREWVGAWGMGERYRVGERWLLFLYRPSKAGLTSAVAGARGRFLLDQQGRVVLGRARALLLNDRLAQATRYRDRVRLRDFSRAIRVAREQESLP